MEEVKETLNVAKKGGGTSGTMPLSDIFFLTMRHWPWILLSVFVCVGVAYVYLLRTPTVYYRSAEILIKDDSKGKSVGADEFADLGLFQSNTNIQNEMTTLKSKDLMEEVVKRLNLDIDYFKEETFHDRIIYGYDQMVKAEIVGYPDEQPLAFTLKVDGTGKVTISDLTVGKDVDTRSYTGEFNDSITTPDATIIVTPTANCREGGSVDLLVRKVPMSQARDSYVGRLTVAMSDEKSTVIRLTLADQSVQRADDVLNTLIGVYNENWIRDRNQIAVSTSNFIDDRLGVIESELSNVDSDISSYKSANLVPDVEAAASMYMSQNQQTQAQMLELNNQLQMTRYIRSYLTSDGYRDQLLPANTGIGNGSIQSLIVDYNSQLLQRNSLAAKSSEKNPLVAEQDKLLAAQRQAIISSVDNEIVNLDTQLKALRQSEANITSRIASNPTQAKNLLSVERQQKVKESLYLFLLQKREENELSQAFTAYNTRIVNKPGSSGMPPTPNRRNILVIAVLLGLFIPFGVTYVKEINNTKLRGRKDIKNLSLPFLGEIPQYSVKTDNNADGSMVVVKAGKRDIINEAFRVLRTNVEFMCNTVDGPKIIALTSFNPGSGKSFISINLATAIALKGRRVLVIDGDMRHGSTSAYVGSPDEGLSNYLNGERPDVRSLIIHDEDCDTLDILPVGIKPPNPTELLESPRFGQLLSELKLQYDYIIIDCPPIEVVADAQIIDKFADRTFFLVRAGLLERSMLPELERLYEEKKYNNMALILNGTRNDKSRYGYSHSYRYGYGYGYGYGYNYGTGSKKKKK